MIEPLKQTYAKVGEEYSIRTVAEKLNEVIRMLNTMTILANYDKENPRDGIATYISTGCATGPDKESDHG